MKRRHSGEGSEVEFSSGGAGEAVDREGPPLNAIKLRLPGLTLGEAGGCLVDLLDLFMLECCTASPSPWKGNPYFLFP